MFKLRYRFLSPDDGAGNGGGQGAQQTSQQTGDTSGQTGGADEQSATKTYTQDELDRLFDDRFKRARRAWEQEERDKAAQAAKPEIERLKTENQKLSSDHAALQKTVRERDAKDAVADSARKAGATDASPIWRMVRSDLEYDDDGKVKNLDALLKDVKAIAPQLFQPTRGKGDGFAGAQSKAQKRDWMREAAQR